MAGDHPDYTCCPPPLVHGGRGDSNGTKKKREKGDEEDDGLKATGWVAGGGPMGKSDRA